MNFRAKPVIDGKFWIVEDNGIKVGILQKNEFNKFVLSSKTGSNFYNKKEELTKQFGSDFFEKITISKTENPIEYEVHGYPTSSKPFNPMFNVQKKLPLFTKSKQSKSIYCAGYYLIKFDKGWVRSFCPKLITVERYSYQGPFKTEIEQKAVLSNAK